VLFVYVDVYIREPRVIAS